MEKKQKNEIRVKDKTAQFRRDFQTLISWATIFDLKSCVYRFCKPKSNHFNRETTVRRPWNDRETTVKRPWNGFCFSLIFSLRCCLIACKFTSFKWILLDKKWVDLHSIRFNVSKKITVYSVQVPML